MTDSDFKKLCSYMKRYKCSVSKGCEVLNIDRNKISKLSKEQRYEIETIKALNLEFKYSRKEESENKDIVGLVRLHNYIMEVNRLHNENEIN